MTEHKPRTGVLAVPETLAKVHKKAEEDRNHVLQLVFQTEEQSWVRHLLYCWITRHNPMADLPYYGDPVRQAIYMLRLKRVLMRASNEELAKYQIDPATRDTQIGWTTNLSTMDMGLMKMKLDPRRRKKRPGG